MTDELTLKDVLFEPFIGIIIFGSNKFALPTWMIRPMFFSQVFVLIWNYILARLPEKMSRLLKNRFDLIIVSLLLAVINYTFAAVVIGYWYKTQEQNLKAKLKINNWVVVIVVFLAAHCVQVFFSGMNTRIFGLINIVIVSFIFYCISSNEGKYIENTVGIRLGKISFPIYLLHMPIIHVFSCFMLYFVLSKAIRYDFALLITFALSLSLLVGVSILWEISITPITNKITKLLLRSKD